MQRRALLGFAAVIVGSAMITPARAHPMPPVLPSCLGDLGTKVAAIAPKTLPGTIVQGVVTPGTGTVTVPYASMVPAAPEQPAGGSGFNYRPTPTGPTPAFCQITFVYYPGGEGPNNPGPGRLSGRDAANALWLSGRAPAVACA